MGLSTVLMPLAQFALFNKIKWLAILALGAGYGVLLMCCLAYVITEWRIRRPQWVDEALSERPIGMVEFPVEVVIRVTTGPLGLDRGVVYFEGGRFGFVGSSFSFLLAAEDFINSKEGPLLQRELVLPKLMLRAPGDKAEIVVRPLLGHGKAYRAARKQFFTEAKMIEGERQWPPLTKYEAPVSNDGQPSIQDQKLEIEPRIEVGG